MMKHNTPLALVTFVIVVAGCWAVSANTARAQEAHEAHGHEEHEAHGKNEIGVFVGGLTNLTKDQNGPSLGVDYTRRITPKIRIGAMYEFASTSLERENLFAGIVVVEPGYNLKFIFAPGVTRINEDEEEEHHGEDDHHSEENHNETYPCCHSTTTVTFVGRLGIGYNFEFSKVIISPNLFVDLLGNGEVHLVYGVSFGFPF
jgi:hypothetical protein